MHADLHQNDKIPMKQTLFVALIIATGLTACNKPASPQFKYIDNVAVNIESLSSANLHAEAVLYNPNKNSITIKRADIDILVDDKIIAVLEQDFDIKVQPNADFTIPLDVKIRLKDLNLNAIGSALGLLGDSGKEIHYLGKIKVKAYGVPFSVKVDYKDTIQFKI
jgi:LEA14-like dessication related protein